jgi:transposase
MLVIHEGRASMRAYAVDLRQRIVAAVERGSTHRVVAQQFSVSLRTVDRYLRLARAGAALTPRKRSGRSRHLTQPHLEQLLRQLEDDPSATLPIHQQRLAAATGLVVSPSTLSRAIARMGWTRKKGRWQPANVTPTHGLPGGAPSNASIPHD